jgi:phage major head subunit gpT-like protein
MALTITPTVLEATYTAFNMRFQQGFQRTKPWWSELSTLVPSGTSSETYAWLKEIPGFREWVGERHAHELVSRGQVLANKPYELTVKVPRDAVEDEQLGIYSSNFEMMGMAAAKWPDKVLAAAIKAGTTALAFDGQPFFHASHPVDMDNPSKGTYSNNKPGFALTPENYGAARAEFRARVNDAGEPMGIRPSLLVVPPQLEDTANRILTNDRLIRAVTSGSVSGVSEDNNIYKNTAKPLVIEELADQPDTWYLLANDMPIRPFIWQLRRAPNMVSMTAPTDPNVFHLKEYVYGSEARGNAGYSLPFLAMRCAA